MPLISQEPSVMDLKEKCKTVIRDCSTCKDSALFRHTMEMMDFILPETLERVCREMGLEQK